MPLANLVAHSQSLVARSRHIHAPVAVNGVAIGDITIDDRGALKFFLDTSVEANLGFYALTVTAKSSTNTIFPNDQSARLSYTLLVDSTVRKHLPDETTITLTVPANTEPQASFLIYLPFVEARSHE